MLSLPTVAITTPSPPNAADMDWDENDVMGGVEGTDESPKKDGMGCEGALPLSTVALESPPGAADMGESAAAEAKRGREGGPGC